MSITLYGQSGQSYSAELFRWKPSFNPVGGVYIILRQTSCNSSANYNVLYVGETENYLKRFLSHEREPDFTRAGVTHIAMRVLPTEAQRLAIERDLVHNYKPSLNLTLHG